MPGASGHSDGVEQLSRRDDQPAADDLQPPGVSKASGLELVCDDLGLDASASPTVVAFTALFHTIGRAVITPTYQVPA